MSLDDIIPGNLLSKLSDIGNDQKNPLKSLQLQGEWSKWATNSSN